MHKILAYTIVAAFAVTLIVASCKPKHNEPPATPTADFPAEVGKILISKCAVSGCHNAASYQNCNGLLLDSWAHLFQGSNNGSVVVAYSPKYSSLLYFVNTDSSEGPVATPTMPQSTTAMSQSPLSPAEYATLKTWIAQGAPDKDGNIPFADNAATRQKIYITQQGCDLVGVIDGKTNLVMRYIPIGTNNASIESPHSISMSSDGSFACVSFLAGNYIQKIDTRTDTVVASMQVGSGSWNIVYIAPGDTMLAASNWASNGSVIFGNTGTMQKQNNLTGSGSGLFVYPHGITSTRAFDTVFITAQYGNVVYRYSPYIPYYRKVSLNGQPPATTNSGDISSPNPHEITMSPDGSKYFVSCQGTNEVRVLDAHTDALLDSIPVGTFPQEMAISGTYPYLFVACMEDAANTLTGRRGSVYVINYNTHQVVTKLYGDFYQPHDIGVDDINKRLYVASTNANPSGPAPHHATSCGGRAGWYSVYDLNSLQPLNNKRYEMTVMPYSIAVRFEQ
jgi:DNA-binding beta-propeller fold protein YncE